MLTKLKKYVLGVLYDYHYHAANYCYRNVDKYGPEHNSYWEDKVLKHTVKEMLLVEKLVKLEEA